MPSTTFTDGVTKVISAWLNPVNVVIHSLLGDGTNAPTTKSQLRSNMGATAVGDAVLTAASTDSAQDALGASPTGKSIFIATSAQARLIVSGVPAGAVMEFAMNTPPTGWLKANGAAVSRTTYADLFSAIGTTFGVGDGSTTFNVPELRGEFIRSWDDGRGIDSGRVFGSAQADLLENHTHNYTSPVVAASVTSGASNAVLTTTTSATGNPNGGLGGSETRPRNVALLACIKF